MGYQTADGLPESCTAFGLSQGYQAVVCLMACCGVVVNTGATTRQSSHRGSTYIQVYTTYLWITSITFKHHVQQELNIFYKICTNVWQHKMKGLNKDQCEKGRSVFLYRNSNKLQMIVCLEIQQNHRWMSIHNNWQHVKWHPGFYIKAQVNVLIIFNKCCS